MFKNNGYATVWEVQTKGRDFKVAKLTTSRKNKDGKYETDFSGFVALSLQDREKVAELERLCKENGKVRIKLGEVAVSQKNTKDEDGKWNVYVNYYMYSFDFDTGSPTPTSKSPVKEEDDFPF